MMPPELEPVSPIRLSVQTPVGSDESGARLIPQHVIVPRRGQELEHCTEIDRI
jgi:hypothetical protein